MGFLRRIANKLTGGWAEVEVDIDPSPGRLGSELTVTATVEVKGEPIDIDGVELHVRCRIEYPVADTDLMDGITPEPIYQMLHEGEAKVAEAQQLAAGSRHTFSHAFPLDGGQASGATVHWDVRAVVVMEGNDPDSGWERITVNG